MNKYNRVSSWNIPAMNRSMFYVPSRTLTTKLSATRKETQNCTSPKRTTCLMVPSILISWFEAYFRLRSGDGRMYFLQDGWRNDRLTKFGPALLLNVELTWSRE